MGEFSGHGESGHGRQQAKRQTGLERKARLELEGTEMHLRKFTIAVLLGTLTVTVRARPQSSGSGGGCGVSRDGVSRQVGDSWSQDGCNNCRCLPSGVPGCTRRICSDREFWEEGRTCSEGKTWEEKTGEDLKVCTCTKGSPSCTDKVVKVASTSPAQCGEDSEGNPRLVGDSWKERSSGIEVNGNHKDCSCDNGEVICQVRQLAEEETGAFVASSPGRLGENAVTCVDSNGTAREEGDSWMDDCNNCMCTESGNSCTKMLCNFALPFAMSGLRTGADSQCLDLLQAGDVHMTLRRDPEVTTSGGVSLALALTDGGEGNIVVGTSGSMYGAVKPLEGPVHYTLESCGQGCSVLIERSSDWFNQFED